VQRFTELTAEETSDLWFTAQRVGTKLEDHFKASSLTFAIQVICCLIYLILHFLVAETPNKAFLSIVVLLLLYV